MTPFIVRRSVGGEARQVYHRASGLHLGSVAQHPDQGDGNGGMWSAWLPDGLDASGDAVGDRARTMLGACAELMRRGCIEPPVTRRMCRRCRNTSPMPAACGDCETEADALARSRADYPEWWAHFDAVGACIELPAASAQTTEA